MALPWHKGSHQLLTDGFAPPSECPRCCSQEAHPGFCRLVSARNRKDGGAPWSGRLFWCQREGGASGAPGPAAGAAAACPSQDAFVCCFPEHTVPCTLERGPGRRDPQHTPEPRGCNTERASNASQLPPGSLCPLPVPWERCHGLGALPRHIPLLRGRAAPHRPPLSPQAGHGDIWGHSWEALAALRRAGKLCTFPAGRQCLPEEHRQPRLRHKG